VLIDVSTAALNPADLVYASGVRGRPETPFVPGIEGVGTTPDGRRVHFTPTVHPHGSIAQLAVAPLTALRDLADDIGDAVALGLGVAGTTGWLALTYKGALRAGESVLVLGATGSVGQIVVQAARALGARRVVAAGRDQATLDALLGRGADAIVTLDEGYEDRLVEASEGGFDLVVDSLYGEPMVAGIRATREGGRIVNLGMRAGRTVELPGIPFKGRDLLSCSVGAIAPEVQTRAFADLCGLARRGEIDVASELTRLADIAASWERQDSSPHVKLLVEP
jgi:NADPH:quinone reductase-like Zn-dependent oxidoreductase